jgi:uncharacterized protein (DUF983 family)
MARHDPRVGARGASASDSHDPATSTHASGAADAERPLRQSLWRGWRLRCPSCGGGSVMKGYLKTRQTCPVCREELSHHRADDGPAYLTILIVGHLMAPLLHIVFVRFRPEPLTLFTIFAVVCIGLSLYLLPRLKGAIIGFQWARRMHGFGGTPAE